MGELDVTKVWAQAWGCGDRDTHKERACRLSLGHCLVVLICFGCLEFCSYVCTYVAEEVPEHRT